MKITAIEPFVCDGGLRQFGFLKVTTDEGIVGWSEIYDFTAVASLATAIRVIGAEFIGLDPFRIEWFNERMWYLARPGIPERIKVLAALDMALWDIKGKALNTPVWNLLGGKVRDQIRVYGHANTREAALSLKERGYTAFKVSGASDPVRRVAELRDAVGDEMDMMMDLHGPPWLTPADAAQFARALQPYNLLFLEDPIPPELEFGHF
jgi:galactonate dehydratase